VGVIVLHEALPAFTVIRIPFDFNDGLGKVPKRFVILCHQSGAAISIKATSNLTVFDLYPERLKGVVKCAADECVAFPVETVIDPGNCFALPHVNLHAYLRAGTLENLGSAVDLKKRLVEAIKGNEQLDPARVKGLLRCLGES